MDQYAHDAGPARFVHYRNIPGLVLYALNCWLNPPDELKKDKSQAYIYLGTNEKEDDGSRKVGCVMVPKLEEDDTVVNLMYSTVRAIAAFGAMDVCVVLKTKLSIQEDMDAPPQPFSSVGRGFIYMDPASKRVFFYNPDDLREDHLLEVWNSYSVMPELCGVFEWGIPLAITRLTSSSWSLPGKNVTLETKHAN